MDDNGPTDLAALYDHGNIVQCSQVDEYCFLCSSVEKDASDSNAAAIRKFVKELVAQKKELPFVVNSVDLIYRQELGTHPQNTPWSKDAIKRHLLFSTEFAPLFNSVVDQLFISIIMRTQSKMIDELGNIDEPQKKSLLESIAAFNTWRKNSPK